MTDEKNITPQPSGDDREVISWYVPPERGNEVVRCYVQPQPLPQGVRPQPPQMAPQRGKKRGWIIFVILAAVLAAIVGVTALVVSLTDDGDSSTPDDGNAGSIVDISGNEECYIPKAPTADGQQMELLTPADTELTPAEVYQKMSASTVTVLATDDRGNTSMGTGVLSILLSVAYVKTVGVKTPEEYRYHVDREEKKYGAFRALSPYAYMLVLLPAVRYGVPALVPNGFAVMCTFGYIVWVDVVILICGFLGAMTLKTGFKQYGEICKKTVSHVMPVLVTMGSLLVVSYIMQSSNTGMMNLLASDVAAVVGRFYPAAAVVIGASGSFITGTGLGSNIMFADMHIQAAQALGMNPITVFAGQNAGASLGNLICPNNTVAASATVDQIGNENLVMKRTLPAFAIILVIYMVLTMLYTCVLFPHFGM